MITDSFLQMFEEKILKGTLNMVAPDAEVAGEKYIVIPPCCL